MRRPDGLDRGRSRFAIRIRLRPLSHAATRGNSQSRRVATRSQSPTTAPRERSGDIRQPRPIWRAAHAVACVGADLPRSARGRGETVGGFFSDEEAEVEEDEDGRRRRSLQPYATLSSTSVSAMTTPRHQPTIFMAYCRAVIQIVSARPSVMPGMPLSGRGQVSGGGG